MLEFKPEDNNNVDNKKIKLKLRLANYRFS